MAERTWFPTTRRPSRGPTDIYAGSSRPHATSPRKNTLEEQIRQQNRELTEATAFLNNVLESSTEYSIIAKDLDGNILAWNEGAKRNYGYNAEEMVGKQNSRILHIPEDVASGRVDALLNTALQTGKAEGTFERVRKNGERFTASVAVTLRRGVNGTPVGFVLISKDITEQKQLEEQLRRKNEELEEQNRRVQEANRLKSEFLANMSHELRTPLNSIIGFSEMIFDGKAGATTANQHEFLTDILSSGRHLLQLINDVLDLAKVESGRMDFWISCFGCNSRATDGRNSRKRTQRQDSRYCVQHHRQRLQHGLCGTRLVG